MVEVIFDFRAWLIIILLSVLGVPVALGKYYLGQAGYLAVKKRFPQITDDKWHRVKNWYDDHGAKVLLTAGIPGLGMLVITGAGAFGISRNSFLIWTFIGKLIRNVLLFLIAAGVFSGIFGIFK